MAAGAAVPLPAARRDILARRVRRLVLATICCNAVEAVAALSAGAVSSSAALAGFGLGSLIEVSSAVAVGWQFSARDPAVRQAREHAALRVTAVSFFALAAFVAVDCARSLLGSSARPSLAGIVLAAASLVVMPCLSLAQRRAGRQLGSASAVADSRQELLCACLSAVLLAGLAVNASFGWSWADPAAGLVIAAAAVREGGNAWRGDTCCTAPAHRGSGERRAGCEPGCACCG
ncbi:MAG TPA: cation transporter [Streptosporangiaceae bacterium]